MSSRTLAELHRVLRPGGLLVLTVPAQRHFFRAWIRTTLSSGFRDCTGRSTRRRFGARREHEGVSSTAADGLARRHGLGSAESTRTMTRLPCSR